LGDKKRRLLIILVADLRSRRAEKVRHPVEEMRMGRGLT
jgi:hypothetical protein